MRTAIVAAIALSVVSFARPAAAEIPGTTLMTHFRIPYTQPGEFRWCIGTACLVQQLPSGVASSDVLAADVEPLVAAMTNGIAETARITVDGVNHDRPESFYVLPDNERETTDGVITRWSRGSDWPPYDVDWHGLEIHLFQLNGINHTSGEVNVGIYGTVPEPATAVLIGMGSLFVLAIRRQR